MRSLVGGSAVLLLAGVVGASCTLRATNPVPDGPPEQDPVKHPMQRAGAATFPSGYDQWRRLNDEIIMRSEEGEARWLYVNGAAEGASGRSMPVGSILVKVQHRLFVDKAGNSQVSDLYKIATMEKGEAGPNNGWVFRAFDPESREELGGEVEACIVCHSQRAGDDYTFRALEDLAH